MDEADCHLQRHSSLVTPLTSQITRHTSHVNRHKSQATRHASTSSLLQPAAALLPLGYGRCEQRSCLSRTAGHTSQIARHTSHVTSKGTFSCCDERKVGLEFAAARARLAPT
jgi:hypothetical protein